jgi:hypothetical protein
VSEGLIFARIAPREIPQGKHIRRPPNSTAQLAKTKGVPGGGEGIVVVEK